MADQLKENRRILWVDIAKGFAIILTIIGHSVAMGLNGSLLRGAIFSFHMPLFFILSGVTLRTNLDQRGWGKRTFASAKRLLPPALITYLILLVWRSIHNSSILKSAEFWKGQLYMLLFASGVEFKLGSRTIVALGAQWFFFAFVIGKAIFDLLSCKIRSEWGLLTLSVLMGILGIAFGVVQWLPFSLDIALAVIPFFYFGRFYKMHFSKDKSVSKFAIFFVIWLVTWLIEFPDYNNWTYLELAARRYTLFPLCYLTAVCGSMCVIETAIFLSNGKLSVLARTLGYIGKNSLYLFSIHIVDSIYKKLWDFPRIRFTVPFVRVIVDLLVFFALMQVKYIYKKIRGDKETQMSVASKNM